MDKFTRSTHLTISFEGALSELAIQEMLATARNVCNKEDVCRLVTYHSSYSTNKIEDKKQVRDENPPTTNKK